MQKKAAIFDLDNTIYPVSSVGDEMFASLFQLILAEGLYNDNFSDIREDMMRRPFQLVAEQHHFSAGLIQTATSLLKELEYKCKIKPFADYHHVRRLPLDKFLVTTGFAKLQQSKIDALQLHNDFLEIHIVDPSVSSRTKKDVFADIRERYRYKNEEVLVVGDDVHSEIKAARELNMHAVIYNPNQDVKPAVGSTIHNFAELINLIN